MLYTHLNLSLLPFLISLFMFFIFTSLICMFVSGVYSNVFIFILVVFLLLLYFIYNYNSEFLNYSLFQYFLNHQFFIFFVVSEVFFFVGIFWVIIWFNYSVSVSSISIFSVYVIYPFGLAFFNTMLLLISSSFCLLFHIYYSHLYMNVPFYLLFTLIPGFVFLCLQIFEFYVFPYSISCSAYLSVFFLATGFHGMHVFVGLLLILFCYFCSVFLYNQMFLGFFNCVFLYWHFVDVVWLFLYFFIYLAVYFLGV